MKNISRRNIGGFTLVEILVVVLIIGILSAVAVPMYQGAVDKSRFSTLLPAAKSIKDAQEAMRMSTGLYTDKMEDLDISMENGELNFTFDIHNSLADPSLFRTTSPKLENVRLASYFDFNPMMAGQKHCEAKAGDERANRLCGPIMQGQEFGTTTDGYIRYLLDKDIDKPTCDDANRSWSSSKGKCYQDTATRCEALGLPAISGQDQCGYTDKRNGIIGEETFCYGTEGYGCAYLTYKPGGTCIGTVRDGCGLSTWDGGVCEGRVDTGCVRPQVKNDGKCIATAYHGCRLGTFWDGGTCVADAVGGCNDSTFNAGGKCVANAKNGCPSSAENYNGGCCEGEYCSDSVPKC